MLFGVLEFLCFCAAWSFPSFGFSNCNFLCKRSPLTMDVSKHWLSSCQVCLHLTVYSIWSSQSGFVLTLQAHCPSTTSSLAPLVTLMIAFYFGGHHPMRVCFLALESARSGFEFQLCVLLLVTLSKLFKLFSLSLLSEE